MNKKKFIKALSEKLALNEKDINTINSIFEKNFIIGKNNKEKIISQLIEKLEINKDKANEIYNCTMEIITKEIKNKIFHPFKGKDIK